MTQVDRNARTSPADRNAVEPVCRRPQEPEHDSLLSVDMIRCLPAPRDRLQDLAGSPAEHAGAMAGRTQSCYLFFSGVICITEYL
jgi:hypothetical protein